VNAARTATVHFLAERKIVLHMPSDQIHNAASPGNMLGNAFELVEGRRHGHHTPTDATWWFQFSRLQRIRWERTLLNVLRLIPRRYPFVRNSQFRLGANDWLG
jgi:hypothetical protein